MGHHGTVPAGHNWSTKFYGLWSLMLLHVKSSDSTPRTMAGETGFDRLTEAWDDVDFKYECMARSTMSRGPVMKGLRRAVKCHHVSTLFSFKQCPKAVTWKAQSMSVFHIVSCCRQISGSQLEPRLLVGYSRLFCSVMICLIVTFQFLLFSSCIFLGLT